MWLHKVPDHTGHSPEKPWHGGSEGGYQSPGSIRPGSANQGYSFESLIYGRFFLLFSGLLIVQVYLLPASGKASEINM